MINTICRVCGRPLNEAQYKLNEQYKSCPRCSTRNGAEHVYYENPLYFGETGKRSTSIHPNGPQSYCVACRSKRLQTAPQRLCHEFLNN